MSGNSKPEPCCLYIREIQRNDVRTFFKYTGEFLEGFNEFE